MGIDRDLSHRIQVGWSKWRNAFGIMCDHKVSLKHKWNFYRTTVTSAMLYGSECCAVKWAHEQKIRLAEVMMLRWICGHIIMDRLRNKYIREKVVLRLSSKIDGDTPEMVWTRSKATNRGSG